MAGFLTMMELYEKLDKGDRLANAELIREMFQQLFSWKSYQGVQAPNPPTLLDAAINFIAGPAVAGGAIFQILFPLAIAGRRFTIANGTSSQLATNMQYNPATGAVDQFYGSPLLAGGTITTVLCYTPGYWATTQVPAPGE